MKKTILISMTVIASLLSAFSCSGKSSNSSSVPYAEDQMIVTNGDSLVDIPLTGEIPPDEYRRIMLDGKDNTVDNISPMNSVMFEHYLNNFRDKENIFQIDGGTDPGAHAAAVFKIAITDENGCLGMSNIWNYLIAADDRYLGVIKADCRNGQPAATDYSASQSIADSLNNARGGSRLALFNDGNQFEIYGIYEDGTVVTLMGTLPYSGSLTFEDIAGADNVITVGKYGGLS